MRCLNDVSEGLGVKCPARHWNTPSRMGSLSEKQPHKCFTARLARCLEDKPRPLSARLKCDASMKLSSTPPSAVMHPRDIKSVKGVVGGEIVSISITPFIFDIIRRLAACHSNVAHI